jgi:23S rRNA (cytosine1962-C5)-methyltransferase
MAVLVGAPPCVIHEDEHILVANKPPGLNTHAPSPYAGEGLYEWLRHREPRWADLAIIHRLDKATSGLIVFAKTRLANKSLTEQFTRREVRKTYLLLVSKPPPQKEFAVRGGIARAGERYRSDVRGEPAETRFRYLGPFEGFHLLAAEPLTGRTHQIRVHCEEAGRPILGDILYGGEKYPRVCLHSRELVFRHPETEEEVRFVADHQFLTNPPLLLRRLMIGSDTTAYRLLHGQSDRAEFFLERWGEYLLASSDQPLRPEHVKQITRLCSELGARAAYAKLLSRHVAKSSLEEAAPQLISGSAAETLFHVLENGAKFEISFDQGYSVGLFLDQRDNRRRLMRNFVAAGFPLFASENLAGKRVLNTFAYTCGFSVCAALAGAQTTSLDLSKKYLKWGQRNFELNGLNAAAHDFVFGDVFDWLRRFRKKGRAFDLIILDPPTFSRSKHGTFQAEKDYGELVTAVLPLLSPNGVLFV